MNPIQRWSRRMVPVALALSVLAVSSCGPPTAMLAQKVVVKAFEEAMAQLLAQQIVALVAHNGASIARTRAQLGVGLKFQSPDTQTFIDQWREADRQTKKLRKNFVQARAVSTNLIDFLIGRADTIGDEELRDRAKRLIEQKRQNYGASLDQADTAISALEGSISSGNDIITALEIAGALGGFDEKLVGLQRQNDEMVEKLPDMTTMIDEGMALVDLEFGALEEKSN